MKKVLLMCAAVLTLSACNSGGGGDSTTTAATTAAGGGDSTTAATTAAGGDSTTTVADGGDSGGGAADFDFVVLRFKSGEFTVEPGSGFNVGDNCGDEASKKPKYTCADFISAPFQQTANQPEFKKGEPYGSLNPNGFLISENGDFWFNIDHITANFYIEDKGSEIPTRPVHYQYIQPYLQMGGGSEFATKWDWWSPQVNLAKVGGDGIGESPYLDSFGKEQILTVTWDVKTWYETVGEKRGIPGNTDEYVTNEKLPEQGRMFTAGNGAQKFGIQFAREDGANYKDSDPALSQECFDANDVKLKLYIGFTDVEIYVKDMDKFMEYVNKAEELTGEKLSDELKAKIKQA